MKINIKMLYFTFDIFSNSLNTAVEENCHLFMKLKCKH